MKKKEFTERLLEERLNVLKTIEGLAEEQMSEPLAEGKWSVKDTLGHLAAWEGEVLKAFEQKARGERPTIGDISDFQAFNTRQAEKRKHQSARETLDELNTTRKRLLAIVSELPDDGDVWSPQRSTAKLLEVLIKHDRHHSQQVWERRCVKFGCEER
jgi:uncharacterized protein (TIGR03083 family)